MVRSRLIVILFVVAFLFMDQGLQSKAAKQKKRPRYSKSRYSSIKKEKPKPPDPTLEWRECGDQCLRHFFGGDSATIRINPVTGDIRDVAVQGEYVYLLVRNFNLITDAIFTIKRNSGRIESIWGIGRHDAASIACDGQNLWVLSRSEKYFLRKLTLSGRGSGDIAVKSLPEGDLRGLACTDSMFYFYTRVGDDSALYQFNRQSHSLRKTGSYRGRIRGVAAHQESVLVLVNEFDTYSDSWLVIMSPACVVKKKLSFVNTDTLALTSNGKHLFLLERRSLGAAVAPVAVIAEKNLVIAAPRIQRVELSFPVASRNPYPYTVDLWIPYPIDRRFQNVRKVAIEPQPRELATDRFGNRWARVRWERVTGSVKAVLKFDIMTAAAAYTVGGGTGREAAAIPPDVRSLYLGETSVYDLSSYVIKSHSSRINTDGSDLSKILAIRDYVNGAIRFSGYGDRWIKASDYLFRGRGDAYGQTVGFAALSRYLGIPARAAGGLLLDGVPKEREAEYCRTWNQVYLPETGWIDIGIGRDYGHAHEYFAARPNRYFITMEGDFDTVDYAHVFTESDWARACRWSSADKNRPADVAPGAIQIKVQDLGE